LGDLGHLFAIISFVSSTVATFSYWKVTSLCKTLNTQSSEIFSWRKFARAAFVIHGISVLGVVITLFDIIYNHRYEYYYAWDHSSNDLPIQYMISCFWEGQEGSFLLWIFWHVLLGSILIAVNKTWEAPLMAVFCLVQAFLVSMIVGVVIPGVDLKFGSSPFILFKDQMQDLPVFLSNPDFVPADGSGLNALLQNYWMVIHPPTLFLGFAATLVPFSYCLAGLWTGKYKEWIRPALPWALFAGLVLGAGILMGGYWAYETLNFGGYWNWDPVENAVYVPWLVLVGAIHAMIIFRSSNKALKVSMIFVIATFILILYSTFLTRSGVLGEASVHSFTDLGLSGQLLIYLLAFSLLSIILLVRAWEKIPSGEDEVNIYSREFWIFIGILVLLLAAVQVLHTTSFPVYNKLLNAFGIDARFAPPAEQMQHYSKWQIWFAMIIALLSGVGQFFWWNKMDKNKLKNALYLPFILSLLIASLIIYFVEMKKVSYILLLTTSLFTVIANSIVLFNVLKSNVRLSGGAIAHTGIGMMLIGILFSSGFSKIVSYNVKGVAFTDDTEMNKENVLLFRGEPVKMNDLTLTYKGSYFEGKDFPGYIPKENIFPTENISKAVAKKDIIYKDEIYYKAGDTLAINPENSFYEVLFEKDNGESFTLFPRVQMNDQMGFVVSPDIQRFYDKDLYTHVSSIPKVDEGREWSEPEEVSGRVNDTMFFYDHIAILEKVSTHKSFPGVKIDTGGIAVTAQVKILGKYGTYLAEPSLIWINQNEGGRVPHIVEELGMRVTLLTVNPETHEFKFALHSGEKDYIVLKAIEKPLINVLWIGTLLLMLGLFIAIIRRYTEFAKMRDKGMEG
jgi:cytochrome c-type biogenesis protein CcmF